MLTLYRAGYSLAGITTIYFIPNRRHKKQPSMPTLYRAGYSLAGITVLIIRYLKR